MPVKLARLTQQQYNRPKGPEGKNMAFPAKFPGLCKVCSVRFPVGEQINWSKADGASHLACGAAAAQAPAAQAPAAQAPQVPVPSDWCDTYIDADGIEQHSGW